MLTIEIELPGAKLGVLEAEGVRVHPAPLELAREMEQVCERMRSQLSLEAVAELPAIRSTRAMFRAWGVDPARYRPSAEALLRRVVQGKGLYRVSNVVDINNLGSIETGWTSGSYNREAVVTPVKFRLGRAGEKYGGIGKQTWHLAGRPVLADSAGPFGSPISDSTRSMITENATQIAVVIFAAEGSPESELRKALALLANRLERWCSARVQDAAVLNSEGVSWQATGASLAADFA
jgi:DNA/RNA-binding domain of Phe-tRNA-synthetase-like protein